MLTTFCQCFAFTGINLLDMLHHVCDVPKTKTCVNQSKLVKIGAQIDESTICKPFLSKLLKH